MSQNFSTQGIKPVNENDAALIEAGDTLDADIKAKKSLMKEVSIHAQFAAAAKNEPFESIADRKLGDVITENVSATIAAATDKTLAEIFNHIISIPLPKVMPDSYELLKNPIEFILGKNPIEDLPGFKKIDNICFNHNARVNGQTKKIDGVQKSSININLSEVHSFWLTP